MTKKRCLEVLQAAIDKHGKPEIINTDQGSQYTNSDWINFMEQHQMQISMDGKGRATDNTWIERFWKSLKYNHVYLNPADTGLELHQGIHSYIEYYNQKKHQSIGMSPDTAYYQPTSKTAA